MRSETGRTRARPLSSRTSRRATDSRSRSPAVRAYDPGGGSEMGGAIFSGVQVAACAQTAQKLLPVPGLLSVPGDVLLQFGQKVHDENQPLFKNYKIMVP